MIKEYNHIVVVYLFLQAGMNLMSSLEDSTTAFFVVSGSVGAASTLVFATLVGYARRYRIL